MLYREHFGGGILSELGVGRAGDLTWRFYGILTE